MNPHSTLAHWRPFLALGLTLATACTSAGTPTDGGVTPDGSPAADSGAALDANVGDSSVRDLCEEVLASTTSCLGALHATQAMCEVELMAGDMAGCHDEVVASLRCRGTMAIGGGGACQGCATEQLLASACLRR